MALFLKIDGITGSATEAGHVGWIGINSAQFGIGRDISMATGHATNREASLPNISEVTVSKVMDSASPSLVRWSVSQYNAKKINIDFITTGDPDPFVDYTLENAVISGYSVSSDGAMPTETIRFSFTKILWRYVTISPDMKTKTPIGGGFDIATAKNI